jgi:hypothetical protein
MKTWAGNGLKFASYTRSSFIEAIYKSIDIFQNKDHYEQIRKNSFENCINLKDVGLVNSK